MKSYGLEGSDGGAAVADDMIGYDTLMQDALRGVVRAALQEAASPRGLPGKHHFYITFRTHAPGVVIPEHLRPLLMEPALTATSHNVVVTDAIDMARVRTSIRAQGKIALYYRDEQHRETRRVIWPFAVGYLDAVRLIMAWCEMRKGFRHFRTDRVIAAEFLEGRYTIPRAKLRAQWKKELEEECTRATDTARRWRMPITAAGLVE